MNASKLAFQRNKKLADYWSDVSRSPDFDEVLIYGRSAMMESGMTLEQMQGANRIVSILQGLCEAEDVQSELPSPGLVHDMSGLIADSRAPKEK